MDLRAGHRFRRVAGVISCEVRDELMVYAPDREMAFSLNSSGRAIWDLWTGDQSPADIAAQLAQRLGVPAEALLPDVLETAGRLESLGLLSPVTGWPVSSASDSAAIR